MQKKNYENLPYEFLLLINNKVIVGRNFQIKGFNPESLRSMELKYTIDEVVDIIRYQFKTKSYDYLYKYYNPYIQQDPQEIEARSKINIYDNEDLFTFQIKVKGRVVAESLFSGNDFPPKVRYDVDIRAIIPEIISTIQQGLTLKNYTREYEGYAL